MTAVRAIVSRDPADEPAIEELEIGAPQAGEILIDVKAVGICGSDVSCHEGHFGTEKPIALGHEGAGVVVEIGPGVTAFEPGDRVVLTTSTCGVCESCQAGAPAYCSINYELNIVGNRLDGSSAFVGGVRSHFMGQSSLATKAITRVRNAVKIPDSMSWTDAAALGCGVQTGAGAVLNSLEVGAGKSIAIFGAGAVGLSALLAARTAGATPIIVVDVSAPKLDLAKRMGADVVIDASSQDPVAVITETVPGGVDFTIEASGNPGALHQATDVLGRRGVCGVLGSAAGDGSFDWQGLQLRGGVIKGISLGDAVSSSFIPKLIALHAAEKFPYDELVTVYDGLESFAAAVQDTSSGRTLKPVISLA
jgi:aryl-alcohol dehydrogenase